MNPSEKYNELIDKVTTLQSIENVQKDINDVLKHMTCDKVKLNDLLDNGEYVMINHVLECLIEIYPSLNKLKEAHELFKVKYDKYNKKYNEFKNKIKQNGINDKNREKLIKEMRKMIKRLLKLEQRFFSYNYEYETTFNQSLDIDLEYINFRSEFGYDAWTLNTKFINLRDRVIDYQFNRFQK